LLLDITGAPRERRYCAAPINGDDEVIKN